MIKFCIYLFLCSIFREGRSRVAEVVVWFSECSAIRIGIDRGYLARYLIFLDEYSGAAPKYTNFLARTCGEKDLSTQRSTQSQRKKFRQRYKVTFGFTTIIMPP
jgi:hypothetical protein